MDYTVINLLRAARARLLKLHYESNSGHIGGNLSCIDALMLLHHFIMQPDDRFILSKGHSAGALYTVLWSLGKLSDAELATFCGDDSRLPAHPSGSGIPGLLFPTGSLGHGPSLAAGLALAEKHRQSGRHVYCLCSDGEWQEGSCWEALIFSVHHQLDNLTLLIDQNGLQGFGPTQDVISCANLSGRIATFGAEVLHVDGHDPAALMGGLKQRSPGKPAVVILDTIKGKGLHFEGRLESHYLPLSEAQYHAALAAITRDN